MSNYNSTLQSNNTDLQAILDVINGLPEAGSNGVTLPELSNPGDASKLLSGYELIDGSGNVVTGTMQTGTPETWTLTLEDGSTVEKVVYVE